MPNLFIEIWTPSTSICGLNTPSNSLEENLEDESAIQHICGNKEIELELRWIPHVPLPCYLHLCPQLDKTTSVVQVFLPILILSILTKEPPPFFNEISPSEPYTYSLLYMSYSILSCHAPNPNVSPEYG